MKGRAVRRPGERPPRSPQELLRELGPPECPPDYPPDGALVRECRLCLGLSQGEFMWRLGAPHRKQMRTCVQLESGAVVMSRARRLLLRHLLEAQVSREAAASPGNLLTGVDPSTIMRYRGGGR